MAKKKPAGSEATYPPYALTFSGNTVPKGRRVPKKVRGPHTIRLTNIPSLELRVEVKHQPARTGAPNLLITIDKIKTDKNA